ncbi:RHOMBOID-like protein 10, chloroplastic [Vitis vinifera]|uniref:RHOMBOID-like protein 10, chloroplastic n=1 Tax=Vitis vinifera TaxID=29760 RepID=A0A438D399_VITVI|nr:RHOMBOID-like protein 10, chloroplastic [Vitis vinifera]
MVGAAVPQPSRFPLSRVGPTPAHLITTAASLRLGHFIHRQYIHLGFFLRSSFKVHENFPPFGYCENVGDVKSPRFFVSGLIHPNRLAHLAHVPGLKNIWFGKAIQFQGISFPSDSFSATCSSYLYFFGGEETRKGSRDEGMSYSEAPRRNSLRGRQWTNILIAINVLVFIGQAATQGKLLLWGAKINSLIDKGQFWRLATSSFLHANIGHLMVNCFSLNSVGPTVENLSGPRRYLAVYFTSAIASSAMSYWLCKGPAVGASGAIFGLVSHLEVFFFHNSTLASLANAFKQWRARRERESGGDEGLTEIAEGASHARPGKNVKRGGFGVESKSFEVEVEERRGRLHATIVEQKGEISSWVRLGPVGKRVEGEWEDVLSVARLQQRGLLSPFGVADLERKRFSIFIPKGRGVKGGWASMVDILRSLGCEESYPNNQKVDVSRSKPNMVKSYMEATKVAKEKERAAVRVDVTKEEVGRNLSKLGHCIVGTWNHNVAKGDDLRGWGSQLARIWRLKGNLGLAKMERGKVLMEFEIPAEAEQASKMGSILLGGVALRLEKWSPKTGCLKEGERSNEAWVRVVGLPVSLWERDILRKIGEACGGLLAIDHQTEKMEELQWARLLVKQNGESPPSLVEVWVDGFCYAVTLLWEIRSVIKFPATEKRGKAVVTVAKEGGDASARAGVRVLGAMEDSRLEDCLLTADGTQCQSSGSGQTSDPTRSEDGHPGGPHASGGLGLLGQATPYRGSKAYISNGPSPPGLGPSPPGSSKAQTEKGSSAVERIRSPLRGPDMDISTCWGKDDQWGLRRGDETQWGGISRTDSALLEEDTRYDNVPSSSGMVALDPSPPFFSSFGRTPRKESFDRSGLIVESTKGDCLCKEIGHSEQFVGKCWDLVEISNDSMEDDRKALCLARPISQEEGAWVEERWEESDLARFSQFLGFSTEGLEKDILEFMVKIRKRRERIHSKAMLEKSKFERELRRLECLVNYEGGKKRKGTVQGRGCQIMEETKIQSMNEGMVRSLGSGRFLDWGALDAQGATGGILICWDKRTLEILEMEMGQFTISCRFRNVEDGKTWIFTGVYGPFSKEDRDTFWGELGAIRGIWDDPWCVGGDFNITLNLGERSNQGRLTGAMRRFAQVMDELELLDIPLQGGVASWSGEGITKLGLDWTGF